MAVFRRRRGVCSSITRCRKIRFYLCCHTSFVFIFVVINKEYEASLGPFGLVSVNVFIAPSSAGNVQKRFGTFLKCKYILFICSQHISSIVGYTLFSRIDDTANINKNKQLVPASPTSIRKKINNERTVLHRVFYVTELNDFSCRAGEQNGQAVFTTDLFVINVISCHINTRFRFAFASDSSIINRQILINPMAMIRCVKELRQQLNTPNRLKPKLLVNRIKCLLLFIETHIDFNTINLVLKKYRNRCIMSIYNLLGIQLSEFHWKIVPKHYESNSKSIRMVIRRNVVR